MKAKGEPDRQSPPKSKKGYSFIQLMKEVEETAKDPKEPKKPKKEELVPQTKEFTKEDLTADQFGDLLAELKPKKTNPSSGKGNGQKADKTQKFSKTHQKEEKRDIKSSRIQSTKQPLPRKVVAQPKTVDDLIRARSHSDSDEEIIRNFETAARPTVSNPFSEMAPQADAEEHKPNFDFDAFQARTKEFEAKKLAKLEKLKEATAPKFKPTVNKKSELLDRKKRVESGAPLTRQEQLYEQNLLRKLQEMSLKREEEEAGKEKELAECTFKPQINKYERLPYDNKVAIADRAKQWEINRQDKLKELQQFKQLKEVNECTFKPETNKIDFPTVSKLYYNA